MNVPASWTQAALNKEFFPSLNTGFIVQNKALDVN